MKRFAEFLGGALIVACLFSVGWEPTPVLAQDEEAGKEVASNQGDIFSGLKGLKGLKDLKADGELSIETDENNEILQFQMSDNVVVVSEELDLKCDLLIYNPKTECLIAKATVSGHRVIVRTPDIKASCLELRIYTEEKPQRFVLTGSPVVVKQGMNMAGRNNFVQVGKRGNQGQGAGTSDEFYDLGR
jgi:lipopolysaccharide export system protein LptA